MKSIDYEILTAEKFAPYGDVIHTSCAAEQIVINDGRTMRFHDMASVDVREKGDVCVSIFKSHPAPYPFIIEKMENHPLGSQMFIPLSNNPYYVVVAEAGEFDESKIKVFLASPQQGVNYAPHTWHHYSLALYETSNFLVIDRKGAGTNLEEVKLTAPIRLELP